MPGPTSVLPSTSRVRASSLPSSASGSSNRPSRCLDSSHIGPIEQQYHQLERLLITDEKSCRIAAANATSGIPDDAVCSQPPARHWPPVALHWMSIVDHTRLRCGAGRVVRSPLSYRHDVPQGPTYRRRRPTLTNPGGCHHGRAATSRHGSARSGHFELSLRHILRCSRFDGSSKCRIRWPAPTSQMLSRSRASLLTPPPSASEPTHGPTNIKESTNANKCNQHNACFACPQKFVKYDTHHLACFQHGTKAPLAQ